MTIKPGTTSAHAAEQSLTVRKKRPYSSVPDDILTDERLSERARLILAWMIGRPEGWELRVGHVQSLFRLSEKQWGAARRELEAAGYYRQVRGHLPNGHVTWTREVWDSQMNDHPPKKAGMVKPSDGSPPDGRPSDGQRGDIAVDLSKHNKEAVVLPILGIPSCPVRSENRPRSLHGVRIWTTEDEVRILALVAEHGAAAIEAIAHRLAVGGGKLALPSVVEDAIAEHHRSTVQRNLLEKQSRERQTAEIAVTRNPEKLAAVRRAAGLPPHAPSKALP